MQPSCSLLFNEMLVSIRFRVAIITHMFDFSFDGPSTGFRMHVQQAQSDLAIWLILQSDHALAIFLFSVKCFARIRIAWPVNNGSYCKFKTVFPLNTILLKFVFICFLSSKGRYFKILTSHSDCDFPRLTGPWERKEL